MLGMILILAVCFVAFTNGANANFKGVASLYGSGTATLKQALYWGTATTFAGSVTSAFFAEELLRKFSGRGIVPDEVVLSPAFLSSVAIGAAFTSFLATRCGFPVSTTHALVGALVGAGTVGAGLPGSEGGVQLSALGKQFFYPLLISPMVAAVIGAVVYGVLKLLGLAPKRRSRILDVAHFFSSGAASFARGLNDTPKMVALLLLLPNVSTFVSFAMVTAMIAIGALLDAEGVAETLGKKVTDMDAGQGFAASLVTAGLVTTASLHSQPVSTTHVSVGSMLGIGTITRQAKWRKVLEVFLAWVSTVPCSALLAALAFLVISRFLG